MKVLIVAINAKYIHSNLAAYSLRAYAMKNLPKELHEEVQIEIAEYTINQYPEQILEDIYRRKPDMTAVSCYIWNIGYVEAIVPELHKVLPEADIWLGGPEVSYDAQKVLERLPAVRGVMLGEGELTFTQLICAYVQTTEESSEHMAYTLNKIRGITYTGFMTQLSQRKLQEEMGERSKLTVLPDLLDMDDLVFPYTEFDENRIMYYESSRGCPFNCAYCLSSIDKSVRLKSIELVQKELDIFLQHKVKQVKFVDRTFNCNHRHAMEIWKYIKENDNSVTNFHFEIAADLITEEEIQLLKSMRPGLMQLEIGVQSVHDATIEEINRKTDFDKIKKVVGELQTAHNIHIHLDLIAGLPKEDYDTFVISFNQVYALKPEQLQLGFLKVLKGSPMADRAEEYQIQYLSRAPYEVLSTKWIAYEEILRLKAVEEMLELYYNSNQFVHTIGLLEQKFEDGFSLYKSLADFYETSGYRIQQPSRLKRYEILFEFAEKYDSERLDLYRESLALDLYLRENVKNRPNFLLPMDEYRDRMQQFYREDGLRQRYLPEYAEYDSRQVSKMTHMEFFKHYNHEVILFDYQDRDPLTQNAKIIKVE